MTQRNLLKILAVAAIFLILPLASFIPSAFSFDINIPKTGQTTPYLTGDDGDLQMGAAWPATGNMGSGRFNDNSDGTVTDLLTGLMWTLNANQIRPAVGTPTYENMNNYINNTFNVSGGGFAGYSDWRIPNMLELESMLNYGAASPEAWLSGEGFTNVQAAEYWVSTVYAVNQGGWTINLGIGETNYWLTRGSGGPTDRYVWTVRGGANGAAGGFPAETRKTGQTVEVLPRDDGALEWGVTAWDAGRFTDNADGTMTDNLTGLMWTKDGSMVSTLTGIDGMGVTNWDRALDFVDYMNTGQSFCSSSIAPCSVDGDCAGNGTTGYCTNNPYTRCEDANDCTIGSCSTIDRRCELPPNNICTNHNQCPGSTNFCVNLRRCSVSTNVLCRLDSQCPTGETCPTTTCVADTECINPAEDSCKGVEGCVADGGEACLAAPDNFGYDDWYLPNFIEVYSMTHWETERFDDDLAAYGFTNIGGPPTTQPGRGCGIWTSTTYAADTTSVLSTAFGWAAGQIRNYPKDTAGQQFCGVSNQYPYIVWPVRTAPAPEPDISVIPTSYDFGGVMQGTDSNVTFTINNIGNGNLSIINIAQIDTFDPPFSLVSGQDNCTGTVVAPGASCTFDVLFSPIGRGSYIDTFDIQSNDPDTSTLIVSITGTGTTAYTFELPQTGQTISQSAGDDGDIMAGVSWPTTGNMGSGRFNDNGDGTVTDLLTGLMWTLNANQIRPAVGTPTYVNMNDYINNTFNVSGGGFAGYSDWRIPNMLELESMLNYGAASPEAWLSGEGFTNVQAAEYWVSTVYAVNQGGWTINLGIGETNYWLTRGSGGPTDRYVWTVRGGANGAAGGFPAETRKTGQTVEVLPRDDGALEWGVTAWDAGRFTDNADGTMTDNLTGLMWTKDGSMVSTLTGIDGMGVTNWDRALDFVDYMNTGQSFCSSSIAPCSVDGDCAGNGTTGYCTNNPYTRCEDANDCTIGSCSTIDRRCELPPNNICTNHNQCPGSTNFCVNLRRCSVSTNVLCRLDSQCPTGETCPTTTCVADTECINPAEDSCKGVEGCVADGGEACLAAPDNFGYDDWYLPNFIEVYSMTHWETERFDDDLAAYGFTNIGGPPTTQPGRGCGIWTSTTYAADTTSVLSTAFGWAAGQIRNYPKDTAGQQFCGVSNQYPYIVWPVRTAPAPEPNISVTPNSYDFGNVGVGITANTVFTVENAGNGDLTITSVSIAASDFNVQSQDCTALSPLASNDTCLISVDFTPSALGATGEDLSIVSNDPDTPALTAGLTGTGIQSDIDLELTKSVNNPAPGVGSTVTFTVAVSNNGPSDATGVEVKDVVPNGYINIQSISNGGAEAGGTITWSGLSINNGATLNLTFNAQVNASGDYKNVAQVTAADQTDTDSTPNNDDGDQSEDDEDNASVSPIDPQNIDLELSKSVDNEFADIGSTVTFTVAVTNNGPSHATGVEVKDVVPGGFSNIQNISNGGTEAGGTITWSGLSFNTPNWYDSNWGYRQKITINSSQVPGDLSDFPVLIRRIDDNLKVSPAGSVGKANGGDILFTSSNGIVKLDHEIESYNSSTGEIVAWVKVPSVLSSTDTAIYMYYGNAGSADQWNSSGTWDDNYRSVWHLKEDPSGSAPQVQDSTINSNNGTSGGSMTSGDQVPGMADGSLDFDGVDDDVSVPIDISLQPANEVTVSAWIKTTDGCNGLGVVDTFRYGPSVGYLIETGDSGNCGDVYWSIGGSNGAVATTYFEGPLNDGGWHHVTGTFNGSIPYMKLYVDGVLRVTNNSILVKGTAFPSALAYSPSVNLELGARENNYNFNGGIDEVRISGTERSADWITASYNSGDPSSFLNFDSQESMGQTSSALNLTFDADVNASGNYTNVAQVTAADQTDSDSAPNNDDGDQSEDDEDNASVIPGGLNIDLSLDKTVDNSTPFVGSAVIFTVAVTNYGPSDATGVSVEDFVPGGFSNIRNINQGGTETGGVITWSGLSITNGSTRNLRFTADVDPSGNYTNMAQVTAADQNDSDSTPDNNILAEDDQDEVSVSPIMGIDLSLSKSINNSSPDIGNTVTFTITVTNDGYLNATGITVEDVVPDGYSNIQNISNGGTEAGGIITWNGLNLYNGVASSWFDADWGYRQMISIENSLVPGDLTNFPVLISVTDTSLIVSPGGNVGKANGGDIMFTDANGTKLGHDLESYNNATGELVAWVNVPNVSPTLDTVIYMYYGNTGAADQWNTSATWDGNFKGVWHLKEDPSGTAPQEQDSTSNNNHGTSVGAMTSGDQVPGLANGSLDFDGADDGVQIADNNGLWLLSGGTLSAWIKYDAGLVGERGEILDKEVPGGIGYSLSKRHDEKIWLVIGPNGPWQELISTTTLSPDTWYHVAGTFDGSSREIYINGVNRATASSVLPAVNSTRDLFIGIKTNGYHYFSGIIDEARVSDIARSADWIAASYNSQGDPSTFLHFSAEETYVPGLTSTINLTFDADVEASGSYLNVAQVSVADQPDSDSTPSNDDGDQSEDDEDNTIIVLPGSSYSILNQPMTNPGDPYPCTASWCDPVTWPANAVYAAPWDDVDIDPCSGCEQILAENFNVKVETTITEIKAWGGYWHGDVPPAADNFTLIFHTDAGGTIGTVVAQPAFTTNRVQITVNKIPMPYNATQSGSSHIFEYTLTLTETLTLTPGTYWVEFFNDTTGHNNNNDFFWAWGYRDYIDGRGIEGFAWTGELNAGGSGTNWNNDTYGNLAIEINGQATGSGCTLLVQNIDTLDEYCTIQEAYDDAGDTHTLRSQAVLFIEDVNFNMNKTVILDGGYDSAYSTVIGKTNIRGNMTATSGNVTIGDVILE